MFRINIYNYFEDKFHKVRPIQNYRRNIDKW